MRILVTEFMDGPAVDELRAKHDVLYDPQLVDDARRLLAEAPACDAIVVRNRTQVRGELLAALKRCKVVGRLGVGLDNIDVSACEARGSRSVSVSPLVQNRIECLRAAFVGRQFFGPGKRVLDVHERFPFRMVSTI